MPKAEHVTAVATPTERGWYSSNPQTLTLKWNKELLSNNVHDQVNISLIGYKENDGMVSYFIVIILFYLNIWFVNSLTRNPFDLSGSVWGDYT